MTVIKALKFDKDQELERNMLLDVLLDFPTSIPQVPLRFEKWKHGESTVTDGWNVHGV